MANPVGQRIFSFFDKPNYLQNTFNLKLRSMLISELMPIIKGRRILDIGCGDGSLSVNYARDNRLVLLDGSTTMVNLAQKNAKETGHAENVHVIHADFLEHEFDGLFDLVLCLGVYAHVQDTQALLTKICKLLAGNGDLIIQVSDLDHPRYANTDFDDTPYGYKLNRIGRSSFLKLMSINGFELVNERSYPWSFCPLHYLPQGIQYAFMNQARKVPGVRNMNSELVFRYRHRK